MFYKRSLRSVVLTLCCLLLTTSCKWDAKSSRGNEKHFELKLKTEHLVGSQKSLSFKVTQRPNSHKVGMPVLCLKRKEGKHAFITDANGNKLRERTSGEFEYIIEKLGVDVTDLCIKMDDEEASKAVFELELVHDGIYQEDKKTFVWERSNAKLSLSKWPAKLYNSDKQLPFKIAYKGKEPLDYKQLVLVFARKEGKASIKAQENQTLLEANQTSGIFKLALQPKDLEHINQDLSLAVEPGETQATFKVHLSYQGIKVGEAKTVCWKSKKVSYSLKNVTRELSGKKKDISFAIMLKDQDFVTLKDALVLRITKKLNSNARIVGSLDSSNGADLTPSINTTHGVFEFPISKATLQQHLTAKEKGLLRGLSIAIDQGDTKAQFELQLVYDKMAVGKPQLVNWREADVKLALVDTVKKIRGENLQPIKVGIQHNGTGDLEKNQTLLRIKRLSNTNAKIIISSTALKTSTDTLLEVGPGVFEVPILESETAAKVIDKLCIQTDQGDKEAKFELQLVYKGMEIGKPITLTWQPKSVKLEITNLSKDGNLVGDQQRAIDFKIKSTGKDQPDLNKSLVLKMTRKKGKDAKIVGTVNGKDIKAEGTEGNSFELSITPAHLGQILHGLQLEVREGEKKAAFELQLFYDGLAMGNAQRLTWESEKAWLTMEGLTKNLRGDQREIQLKIKNQHPEQLLEKDTILRLTRKKGFESTIAHVKGTLGMFREKENGLYELSLQKSDIGRDIAALKINPRKGELQAEFAAQLVYDGIEMGEAQTITWHQKDIQFNLVDCKIEQQGRIRFEIQKKGKDHPEDGKLAIRFKRKMGHLAAIGRRSTHENIEAKEDLALAQETGEGFFEFPLHSNDIGSEITDFVVLLRKGERKAKFTVQLVYDQVEIGKAKSISWEAPAIGLSLKDLPKKLRGYGPEGATIGFTIKKEKTPLEEGKLLIRFTRNEGSATIELKNDAVLTVLQKDLSTGIFEFGIPTTEVDHWIKDLQVIPKEREEQRSVFTTDLIYDGNKIGKSQKVKWSPLDIKLDLSLVKDTLGGDVAREVQEEDHIIKFKIQSTGKDLPEAGKLFLVIQRIDGRRGDVKLNGRSSQQFSSNSEQGYFRYEVDTKKLGEVTSNLVIDEVTGEASAGFRLQLIYDEVEIGNHVRVNWTNIALKRGAIEQAKEKQLNAQQKKEAASQSK